MIPNHRPRHPGTCPAKIQRGDIGVPGQCRICRLDTASRRSSGENHCKPSAGHRGKLASLVDYAGDSVGETAALYPVDHH